jgi:hypothetical protein
MFDKVGSGASRSALGAAPIVTAVFLSGGCGSTKEAHPEEAFQVETPFSRSIAGNGEAVCWSVKRVFLSQGYILERSDALILTGTKVYQKDDETSILVRLQTTCVDNKNGSSTVFASASREVSKLQRVKQSVMAGVSIATVTVPAGSALEMHMIRRETIQDPDFYAGFYRLVRQISDMDRIEVKDARVPN